MRRGLMSCDRYCCELVPQSFCMRGNQPANRFARLAASYIGTACTEVVDVVLRKVITATRCITSSVDQQLGELEPCAGFLNERLVSAPDDAGCELFDCAPRAQTVIAKRGVRVVVSAGRMLRESFDDVEEWGGGKLVCRYCFAEALGYRMTRLTGVHSVKLFVPPPKFHARDVRF